MSVSREPTLTFVCLCVYSSRFRLVLCVPITQTVTAYSAVTDVRGAFTDLCVDKNKKVVLSLYLAVFTERKRFESRTASVGDNFICLSNKTLVKTVLRVCVCVLFINSIVKC